MQEMKLYSLVDAKAHTKIKYDKINQLINQNLW